MNLGLALMREGRFAEAEPQLLEALNLRKSPNLLLNIGALYYEEERFEEAARYFEQSLAIGVTAPTQYRNLGDANRHLGRTKDAKDAYLLGRKLVEQEITRNPRRAESHVMLGYFSVFLGDRQRAQFEISQALAIEPESGVVMRDAAIAYEWIGQREEALAVLRKAPRRLLEELNRQPDVKDLRRDSGFRSLLLTAPAQ
jgi:tetratricopeptide (TPR) repeat protein